MTTHTTLSIDSVRFQLPPCHASEPDSQDIQYQEPEVGFIGSGIEPRSELIVVTGRPGVAWGKDANLGEETGLVAVDRHTIGSIMRPKWTKSNVVVSEHLTKLPESAQRAYAQAIIDKLKPERVALLDQYSASTYISDQPISSQDAPIRYLSTTNFDPGARAEAFAPPNVIKTTSLAFISILSAQTTCSGTLILLPRPEINKREPLTIEPGSSHAMEDSYTWSVDMMNQANSLLLDAIGESEKRR